MDSHSIHNTQTHDAGDSPAAPKAHPASSSESSHYSDRFCYQLLARLKQDCEYYLGAGGRCKKHLWALDEAEQIAKMRELFNLVPEAPEWLSLEQIDGYAERMIVCKTEE